MAMTFGSPKLELPNHVKHFSAVSNFSIPMIFILLKIAKIFRDLKARAYFAARCLIQL